MAVSISYDLDGFGKIKQCLNNLDRRLNPSRVLMLNVAAALRASTQDRFDKKESPDGKAWRSKDGRSLSLLKSGDLRKKLEIDAEDDRAIVGSNLEYAAIHQEGGVIRPKNAKVLQFTIGNQTIFAKSVTIPKTPYLGISKSDEDLIVDTVGTFFEESIKA